jgi:putative redox protein
MQCFKVNKFTEICRMKTAKVVYLGELRATSIHLASGQEVITDAPVDNMGKGSAFSPTDLCATSLASCMITTLGIYAGNHQIILGKMEAEVQKIMASDPRRIAGIEVHLTIGLNEMQLQDEHLKTVLTRVAHNCPVARSLHPDLLQTIKIEFVADTN